MERPKIVLEADFSHKDNPEEKTKNKKVCKLKDVEVTWVQKQGDH